MIRWAHFATHPTRSKLWFLKPAFSSFFVFCQRPWGASARPSAAAKGLGEAPQGIWRSPKASGSRPKTTGVIPVLGGIFGGHRKTRNCHMLSQVFSASPQSPSDLNLELLFPLNGLPCKVLFINSLPEPVFCLPRLFPPPDFAICLVIFTF